MCDKNVDEIPCLQKPYHVNREGQDDVNAELKGRPLLYTGVVWIGIVRRFLIPRTCSTPIDYTEGKTASSRPEVAPAPPRVVAHVQDVNPAIHEPPLKYKKPIVTGLGDDDDEDTRGLLRRRDEPPSSLRTLVVQVHEISAAAAAQARLITEDLGAILRDGQETTTEVIETVRSENGKKFRMAAISASSIVGYLAGLKRGVVTRMVYSATGATAMATICYPDETKVYNRQGLATIRRWMVLGLSCVHMGPQKPLGSGDTRIAYNTDVEDEEENKLLSSESIIASLMQNLGSIGHHIEDIKAKLIDSSQKTESNETTEGNTADSLFYNSVQETSVEEPPPLQPDRFVNLSSKNNEDLTRDIPYSPALPVPPKLTSSRNKLNIPLYRMEENTESNYIEDKLNLKNKKSRDFSHVSREEDELRSDEDGEKSDIEEQEENSYDFSDKTFVIPTGGIKEKLERTREVMRKTSDPKIDDRPLNQKLTVYYREMPEEEKTSREKGYDDAYSNRGK